MSSVTTKEILYSEYCHKCKHRDESEAGDACHECLNTPARPNTHKPLNYKENKHGDKKTV